MTDKRTTLVTLYLGLALTFAAVAVPYVNEATLAGHIKAGYPTYPEARIDTAVSIYLVYLSVVGALGVVCWVTAIWAVKARKRWAPAIGTAFFVLGAGVALFDLLVKDTSGDTGLPPMLGWAGMLPSLAGLVAVALLWKPGKETPA